MPYELTHSQFVLLASIHWLSLHKQDVTQILLSSHTKNWPNDNFNRFENFTNQRAFYNDKSIWQTPEQKLLGWQTMERKLSSKQ